MLKRYSKEILLCILAPVITILMLVVIVYLFEYFDIHILGSREMWIGVSGSIFGGTFTLIGVLMTIFRQQNIDNEVKRLEKLPILDFKMCNNNSKPDVILTVTSNNELITTAFTWLDNKKIVQIIIKTANENCAFDLTFENLVINGEDIPLGTSFIPSTRRLLHNEKIYVAFGIDVITNIFCLLRIAYKDIFGNKYYQDLPFTYFETILEGENIKQQYITFRDIKPPVLQKDSKILKKSAEEYLDYKVFCK